MKLRKFLIPCALLMAAPLASCTPVTPSDQNTDDGDVEDISLDETIQALEELFDIELDYDDEDGAYYADVITEDSLEDSVTDIASQIDFLIQDGEVEYYEQEDEYGDIFSGYVAYFNNESETVYLTVYSYEYEGDNYVTFYVYEVVAPEEAESWSEIDFNSYVGIEVNVPEPEGYDSLSYYADDGEVMVCAFGATADDYANICEEAGLIVDDSLLDFGYGYFANDEDYTFEIWFYDYEDDGEEFLVIDVYQYEDYSY